MKVFLLTLLVVAISADRLDNTYLPPRGAQTSGGSGNFLSTPGRPSSPFGGSKPSSPFGGSKPSAPSGPSYSAAGSQQQIKTISYTNENPGDGTYQYQYETENRITAQETGQLRNPGSEHEWIAVQGSYSYTSPEGQTITVNYVADDNGFQPVGDHLPTPPPIPDAILKSLELNAAEEAKGNRPGGSGGGGGQAPGRPGSSSGGGYRY